jgi:hypothetical protein
MGSPSRCFFFSFPVRQSVSWKNADDSGNLLSKFGRPSLLSCEPIPLDGQWKCSPWIDSQWMAVNARYKRHRAGMRFSTSGESWRVEWVKSYALTARLIRCTSWHSRLIHCNFIWLFCIHNHLSRIKVKCRIWGSHSGGYGEFYLLGYNAV